MGTPPEGMARTMAFCQRKPSKDLARYFPASSLSSKTPVLFRSLWSSIILADMVKINDY